MVKLYFSVFIVGETCPITRGWEDTILHSWVILILGIRQELPQDTKSLTRVRVFVSPSILHRTSFSVTQNGSQTRKHVTVDDISHELFRAATAMTLFLFITSRHTYADTSILNFRNLTFFRIWTSNKKKIDDVHIYSLSWVMFICPSYKLYDIVFNQLGRM